MTSLPSQQSSPALLFDETAVSWDDNDTTATTAATTAAAAAANLGGSSSSVNTVIVHPLVLLQILDHHTRRQDTAGRVIGTLLGKVHDDISTVEVTNCFAVPHAERGEEVAIGKDFNKTMLALHLRSNRKEVVVGWYASAAAAATATATDNNSASATDAPLVSDTSSLIHDFYSGETEEGVGDPVHLVVDTRLLTDQLPIRVYKSSPIVVQGEAVGNMFHELNLQLKSSEPEAICMNEMIAASKGETTAALSTKTAAAGAPDVALQAAMERLHQHLETALSHVTDVVNGKVPANAAVGRQIADTLATVPRIRPAVFDRLFHDSLQDLLMVTYLSNITRTQLTLAEKLNASLGVTTGAEQTGGRGGRN